MKHLILLLVLVAGLNAQTGSSSILRNPNYGANKLAGGSTLPASCVDSRLYFVTNTGAYQCVNGTWKKFVSEDSSGDATITGDLTVTGTASISATLLTGAGPVYNVKAPPYSAKGDGRVVYDAAITAGQATLTSATAAFTAADNSKKFTVGMGAQTMWTGTYTSGGTITGTTGQSCTLTAFNGAADVAATIYLTAENTIASGTRMMFSNVGAALASAPTTATLGNGTATCSGEATIVTTLRAAPIVTTGTVVNATTVTLGTTAVSTVTNATLSVATDDSAAIQAAITAAGVSGGTVYFPAGHYLILDRLTFPLTGSSVIQGTPPKQVAMRLTGDGPSFITAAGTQADPPFEGSILDLRYSGAEPAAIDSRGSGFLEIDHLTFWNGGDTTVPMFQTTNTVVHIHDNMWRGVGDGRYGTTNQDAIILGGTSGGADTATGVDGTSDAPFYGLGSVVERNGFDRLRRGIYARTWVNQTAITNNYWYTRNGAPDASAALLEVDAYVAAIPASGARLNISQNWFEILSAKYGIKMTKSSGTLLDGNQFWDAGPVNTAYIRFEAASPNNLVLMPALAAGKISDASTGNGVSYACANGQGWCFQNTGTSAVAVQTTTTAGYGIKATETSGYGLWATATTGKAVYGTITDAGGAGVWGNSSSTSPGVAGYNNSTGTGVYANTASGTALSGLSATGNPLLATAGTNGAFKINQNAHPVITAGGSGAPTVTSCGTGSTTTGNDTYGTITTAGVLASCKLVPRQWWGATPNFALVYEAATGTVAPITERANNGITFTAETGKTYLYLVLE